MFPFNFFINSICSEEFVQRSSHIFTNVMSNSLKYLNIEPENNEEEELTTVAMPKVVDKKTEIVETELKKLNIDYKLIGNGNKIMASGIDESNEILRSSSVLLVTNKPTMPNLTGWSKRELLELEKLLDITIEIKGDGFVTSQSIKIDEKINKQTKLTVKLGKPFN